MFYNSFNNNQFIESFPPEEHFCSEAFSYYSANIDDN